MKNPKYIEKNGWVGLFVAFAITALFVVFSTPLYECLYYSQDFSNEMFNENLYPTLAIFTSVVVWGVAGLYYLIIDRFERWYHWFIAFLIVCVCAPAITIVYPDSIFSDMNLDYSVQLQNMAIINLGVTIVLFLVVSFCIKRLSLHCSTTPF